MSVTHNCLRLVMLHSLQRLSITTTNMMRTLDWIRAAMSPSSLHPKVTERAGQPWRGAAISRFHFAMTFILIVVVGSFTDNDVCR